MVAFFSTWWPIMVLLALPVLARRIMHVVITRAFLRLDKSHPDDLPQTAGEWLASELARVGLDYRVQAMVTDEGAKFSTDAFHPRDNVIQLSAETHFKRDPMHWAIAAHELGHARFHHALPRFARFTIFARFIQKLLVWTASGLLVGNLAFALPHVTNAALLLFALAATLALVRLVDEMAASIYAMQSLRASPVYVWSHLRSARIMLTLAFSTYLVAYLSYTLLLSQWHQAEALTRTALVPPLAQLTTLGFVAVVIASVVLVVHPFARLVEDRRTRLARDPAKRSVLVHAVLLIGSMIAVPTFLLLVYDVRADRTWAYLLMVSLVSAHGYFVSLLHLPYSVLDMFVLQRIAKKLAVDPTHRSREFVRDRDAGWREREGGNRALGDIIDRLSIAPPKEYRIAQLLYFCHLPLVIAFWLT